MVSAQADGALVHNEGRVAAALPGASALFNIGAHLGAWADDPRLKLPQALQHGSLASGIASGEQRGVASELYKLQTTIAHEIAYQCYGNDGAQDHLQDHFDFQMFGRHTLGRGWGREIGWSQGNGRQRRRWIPTSASQVIMVLRRKIACGARRCHRARAGRAIVHVAAQAFRLTNLTAAATRF